MADVSHPMILETGDDASAQTSLDIRLLFETRFAEIRRSLSSLPPAWPGDWAVQELTNRAGGLFVWATTALDFVKKGIPEKRLRSILTGDWGGKGKTDSLYKQVLEISFEGLHADEFDTFKKVAGAIVLAKTPLRQSDIQRLLCDTLSPQSVEYIINNLEAVVRSGSACAPLRVCHQSFPDFLLDPERSGSFAIHRAGSTTILTLGCLRLMNDREDGLKFNISGLETSHCLNSRVPDLEKRIKDTIPTHLSYSCRFWAEHLQEVSETDVKDDILLQLRSFLHDRVLY